MKEWREHLLHLVFLELHCSRHFRNNYTVSPWIYKCTWACSCMHVHISMNQSFSVVQQYINKDSTLSWVRDMRSALLYNDIKPLEEISFIRLSIFAKEKKVISSYFWASRCWNRTKMSLLCGNQIFVYTRKKVQEQQTLRYYRGGKWSIKQPASHMLYNMSRLNPAVNPTYNEVTVWHWGALVTHWTCIMHV